MVNLAPELMLSVGIVAGGCYLVLVISLALFTTCWARTRIIARRWYAQRAIRFAILAGLPVTMGVVFAILMAQSRLQVRSAIKWCRVCTHVQVTYFPNAYEAAFRLMGLESSKWRTKFELSDRFTLVHSTVLDDFAEHLETVKFSRIDPFVGVATNQGVVLSFFENNRKIGVLGLTGESTLKIGRLGVYDVDPNGLLDAILGLSPATRAASLHAQCASKLMALNALLDLYHEAHGTYPPPDNWCDLLIQDARRSEAWFGTVDSRSLRCPGKEDEGPGHYAFNPHAANTPGAVLLFETSGGWNQHGGIELASVRNHETGLCTVLLNDPNRTVLFVDSSELEGLVWGENGGQPPIMESGNR